VRDILVSLIIFGSLPVILLRPDFGIMVWAWIGFMNPHRLSWGAARDFPFALIVAVTILVGMLVSGRWRFPPITRETVLLALFTFWMQVTTFFAISQVDAWAQWDKVVKIQLMIFVTIMVIRSQKQLRTLVWVIAASLGFYGVKGGIFTVVGGGANHVRGPEGTFIEGNNEIGLALLMTIPLMRYLQVTSSHRWVRAGLTFAMLLSGVAILGTQSRGALVGIVAMVLFLLWKSKHRLGLAIFLLVFAPIALSIMPQTWYDRMGTIRNYEEDASAMGRVNSWYFAFNLARARPLVGGGFETFSPALFARYAPNPTDVHDAHSIYFEILGEHGFVGLGLFLTLGISLWRTCSRTIRFARDDPDMEDLEQLMRMVQVSFVAYAVSGAFLGLAYFDLFYNLLAITVIAGTLVSAHRRTQERAEKVHADRGRLRGLVPHSRRTRLYS
jgi:probable O-glycosylation ligase (exosortase A-associated)